MYSRLHLVSYIKPELGYRAPALRYSLFLYYPIPYTHNIASILFSHPSNPAPHSHTHFNTKNILIQRISAALDHQNPLEYATITEID